MVTRARDGNAVLDTRRAMVPCVGRHVSPAQLGPGPCRQLLTRRRFSLRGRHGMCRGYARSMLRTISSKRECAGNGPVAAVTRESGQVTRGLEADSQCVNAHGLRVAVREARRRLPWLRAKHAAKPRARDENTRRNSRNARLWCAYAQTRSGIPAASAGESVGNCSDAKGSGLEVETGAPWLRAKRPANPGNASASTQSRSSGLRTPSAPRFSTCR